MKILAINSSLSGSSTSKALAHLNFDETIDFELINLKDLNMSFADGRDYREYDNDNTDLIEKMINADAIIIGTPIFQASIPGVLKNVFDLLPINALSNKPVGTIITAGSARHYLVAQQQLLPILNYLKMDIVPKYVFIESADFNNDILRDDLVMRIEALSKELITRTQKQAESLQSKYSFL